jgi:hypothetical protein
MSVWVMISPFTIAVALTTDGMVEPNSWGFSGSLSAEVLLGSFAACCATAVPATASMTAANPTRARVDKNPEPAATIVKSLAKTVLEARCRLSTPAERRLSGHSLSA